MLPRAPMLPWLTLVCSQAGARLLSTRPRRYVCHLHFVAAAVTAYPHGLPTAYRACTLHALSQRLTAFQASARALCSPICAASSPTVGPTTLSAGSSPSHTCPVGWIGTYTSLSVPAATRCPSHALFHWPRSLEQGRRGSCETDLSLCLGPGIRESSTEARERFCTPHSSDLVEI